MAFERIFSIVDSKIYGVNGFCKKSKPSSVFLVAGSRSIRYPLVKRTAALGYSCRTALHRDRPSIAGRPRSAMSNVGCLPSFDSVR